MTATKLTEAVVKKLAYAPVGKQLFVGDTELPGFGLRIGATAKTFFVEKRVRGKTRRFSIGRHPQVCCHDARACALQHLAQMSAGVDPAALRRSERARSVVLGEVYAAFVGQRRLRPSSRRDYDRAITKKLADWLACPVEEISRDMVRERHATLGKSAPAQANLVMRSLRSVLSFSRAAYQRDGQPVPRDNPVHVLTEGRLWFKIARRTRWIQPHEMRSWFEAVEALANEFPSGQAAIVRDYLLVLLFTGLRKGEAARLRWEDVDFDARTIAVRETKNHDDLVLPMSNFLEGVLRSRRKTAVLPFVFPSDGRTNHLVEVRRPIDWVIRRSGVAFSLHDLRRTFATTAESLDLPTYAVKRLLNHRSHSDVTQGYIQATPERLREPMERIARKLVELRDQLKTVAS